MKPYTFTFTSDQVSEVRRALAIALRLLPATDVSSAMVSRAIATLDSVPCEGGFESDAERSAASCQRIANECATWGCD